MPPVMRIAPARRSVRMNDTMFQREDEFFFLPDIHNTVRHILQPDDQTMPACWYLGDILTIMASLRTEHTINF